MLKPASMKTLIVLFAATLATITHADMRAEFAAQAHVLPRALARHGYTRLGNLELAAFDQRVDGIQVHETRTVRHKQELVGFMTMERSLAEWRRTSTGDVTVATPEWAKSRADVRPLVALHESLGALGYSDDLFSCSSSLAILASDPARQALGIAEIARIEKIAESTCRIAGGTTGVTGGGDEFIATIRQNSIAKAMRSFAAPGDHALAADELESALFADFERKPTFKYKGSIFDPNYKNARQCFDPKRGRVIEETIKVWYNGVAVPKDPRNGWTLDAANNCLLYHGRAIHSFGGQAVQYSVQH
jgi:hypothetical protein